MRPNVKSERQPVRPKLVKAPTPPESVPRVDGTAPASTGSGGRKKKKKKGKGRGVMNMEVGATIQRVLDDNYDDNDDLPELDQFRLPGGFTHTHARSRLSTDLESVHLSTTASLNSLSSEAHHGARCANVNGSHAARAELFAEMGRMVGVDAANAMDDQMRRDLNALPVVRDWMRETSETMGADSEEEKERILRAISQEILQSSGIGTVKTNGVLLDANPLSEIKLTHILEHFMTGKGTTVSGGTGQTTSALHANLVVSHEFLADGEDGVSDDEMYSEGELDERQADGGKAYVPGWNIKAGYSELDEAAPPGAYPSEEIFPVDGHGIPGEKFKNGRRQETGNVTLSIPVPDCNTPPASDTSMAPVRNAPPPSSRAAGKQPMAYAPTAPTATTAPANPVPPRSARAAAKAPAPPQSYANHSHPHHNPSPPVSNDSAPQKHRPPGGLGQGSLNKSSSKIWSTNTTEERERIKEFWLGLSEMERRRLVEVEKETVLKRMKEQQRHSCTCAVCGRKRNAIEEELEVLYDAYYEELEQYANLQQRYASSGGTLSPPPGPGPFPGSVELDKDGLPVGSGKTHGHSHPPSARVKSANALTNGPKKGIVQDSEFDEEEPDGDYDDEDEYDDDEEDEEDDDEEDDDVDPEDDIEIRNRVRMTARDRNRGGVNGKANGRDVLNFGSSLTAAGPGNILTVADDLLKNDGQKFLEMMEQLAKRRMQREEVASQDVEDDNGDEDDEEGDDAEDDEEEEEGDDGDEEEQALTEEDKIAEGKRMFSIFAARMFEQRVLQAYREKVAQERQRQLLAELEEEETVKSQREAKKQKENQKKKDKKRQQKLAKEEERAAKAAERAAEEAALKERVRKLEEEQRKKREEERTKREAARKVAEEERLRKEEERRRRLAEEKEQQAERERKRREKDERRKAEQREREERERKAREEREAKLAAERAEKAKKEQQEKEEREKRLAKEREEREKAEKEAKERQAKEQQSTRNLAAKNRTPSSPSVNASSSGSRPQQQQNAAPKKILNKSSTQPVAPAPAAPGQPTRQPSRPTVSTPQQIQPPQQTTIASPTAPVNVPPLTPTFPQGGASTPGIPPPMMSPQRSPFPPQPGMPGYVGFVQQMQVPPLGPSPIPRTPFGAAPPFEAGFGRGPAQAAPIGPPPKGGIPNSLTSPILAPGAAVPNRRMSSATDLGPITRPTAPIAPIARPNGVNGDASGSGPGSGGASPSRRASSPKGVLGSSALATEDDEVVTAPLRRIVPGPVGPVGQGWHSPRSSVATPPPWTAHPPGFSPSRAAPGPNLTGIGGQWIPQPPHFAAQGGAVNDWSAHPGPTGFFGGSQFMHQNHHSATTPPPHSTGN